MNYFLPISTYVYFKYTEKRFHIIFKVLFKNELCLIFYTRIKACIRYVGRKKACSLKPNIERNENKRTLTFYYTYCLLSQREKKNGWNEINILKTICHIQEHYAKTMFSINYWNKNIFPPKILKIKTK